MSSDDWKEDCMRFWGKVLGGPDAHWCQEYDELPINAWCQEYQNCQCGKTFKGKIVGWFMGFYWKWVMCKYLGGSFEDLMK